MYICVWCRKFCIDFYLVGICLYPILMFLISTENSIFRHLFSFYLQKYSIFTSNANFHPLADRFMFIY